MSGNSIRFQCIEIIGSLEREAATGKEREMKTNEKEWFVKVSGKDCCDLQFPTFSQFTSLIFVHYFTDRSMELGDSASPPRHNFLLNSPRQGREGLAVEAARQATQKSPAQSFHAKTPLELNLPNY